MTSAAIHPPPVPTRGRAVAGPLVLGVAVVSGAVACGTTDEASRETLPPLVTTTSTTMVTTTDPDAGKTRFYEIKSGDSIAEIALAFGVPASEIIRINNIENPDTIQVGQIIQIPTDIVLVEELPDVTTTTADE